MVRCTGKVLALLREPTQPIGTASGEDWYVNLVWVERRKCLLLTHAGTLFSQFVADVTVADLRPIGPFAASAIRSALRSEGLPVDTFGDLTTGKVAVAKTADRRILGSMNDLASIAMHLIALAGGLARCDLDAVNHDLHRTINSLTGYTPPIELVSAGRVRTPQDPLG
ncbi:MAG: DUF6933 domain-containing protein [Nocardioidaceae bacterium]